MKAWEKEAIDKFVAKLGNSVRHVEYEPVISRIKPHYDDLANKIVRRQLHLRPDAIIWLKDEILIVEVKKRADWQALGELLAAEYFFRKEFVFYEDNFIKKVCLAKYVPTGFRELFEAFNIEIIII